MINFTVYHFQMYIFSVLLYPDIRYLYLLLSTLSMNIVYITKCQMYVSKAVVLALYLCKACYIFHVRTLVLYVVGHDYEIYRI